MDVNLNHSLGRLNVAWGNNPRQDFKLLGLSTAKPLDTVVCLSLSKTWFRHTAITDLQV